MIILSIPEEMNMEKQILMKEEVKKLLNMK